MIDLSHFANALCRNRGLVKVKNHLYCLATLYSFKKCSFCDQHCISTCRTYGQSPLKSLNKAEICVFCLSTCISSKLVFLTSCVFVLRIGYQVWESGGEQLNRFLSVTATNINCLLNGSLQSFGTTNGRVLLFHSELPCARCPFTPTEKRETHQIQLPVQRLVQPQTASPYSTKRRVVKQAIWWYEWSDIRMKYRKGEVTTSDRRLSHCSLWIKHICFCWDTDHRQVFPDRMVYLYIYWKRRREERHVLQWKQITAPIICLI